MSYDYGAFQGAMMLAELGSMDRTADWLTRRILQRQERGLAWANQVLENQNAKLQADVAHETAWKKKAFDGWHASAAEVDKLRGELAKAKHDLAEAQLEVEQLKPFVSAKDLDYHYFYRRRGMDPRPRPGDKPRSQMP